MLSYKLLKDTQLYSGLNSAPKRSAPALIYDTCEYNLI